MKKLGRNDLYALPGSMEIVPLPAQKSYKEQALKVKGACQQQHQGYNGDGISGKRKLVLAVMETKKALLESQDLDGDGLITVEDQGSKHFLPRTYSSRDGEDIEIKGNYPLANLLQELFLAEEKGEKYLEIDVGELYEDPVHRLERLIKHTWWDNLTRTIDAAGIAKVALDPKNQDTPGSLRRIYVPNSSPEQYSYFTELSSHNPSLRLDVQWLPPGEPTPEFIHGLDHKPGLLALEMINDLVAPGGMRGLPFIVPGGRFNELYNWDSAFCAWGMLDSHTHIVKAIIRHFAFEIEHYGKVCNANRSYYLGRAQPPFLTDLALRTYRATRHEIDAKELLRLAILAAIKEYHNYWMRPPRYDEATGLTRYRPIGAGFPPECEDTQFTHVLSPYAQKYGLSVAEITAKYNAGEIREPELDEYCLHDRAVRECGHDNSNRVEGVCANLGTIDLQCLLYKYETDIAHVIRSQFDDHLQIPAAFCAQGQVPDRFESSASWDRAAMKRKKLIDKYCWNEAAGLYFDYNTLTKERSDHETVTAFWALWCGVASPHQAVKLVEKGLPRFEHVGGLSATTERSRGPIDEAHPQKQWDFPHGWPPHQMLAWEGLKKYGYHEEAERLVYKWLHMVTKVFVDYNGTVVEKYDVTRAHASHKVDAEYGNQGLNFKFAPQEGFGWTNASIVYGISLLNLHAKRALGVCASYETYAEAVGK